MMWSFLCEATNVAPLTDVTGLGAAGLMGAMWLWERRTSRQREQQLDEAHGRIMADKMQMDALVSLVRQNTEAMTRVASTQEYFLRRMEYLAVERNSHERD
ncbi:MAG TPA: hypothetical protein VFE58_17875 [Tepidisphaeraceae bacterium]|nr:hypothetical protein [Tepidisphaeraceae bacterium]